MRKTMDDMPAIDPDSRRYDTGDDAFADDLAGNVATRRPSGARPGLYGIAQGQLLGLAEDGKAELVRNVATIAGIVREIATQVEGVGIEPFAGYVRQAADLVDELHGSVRDKSVEALIDDGRDLIRQQPEIAIAAAVIAGFLAARVLKARR
jgi:hypothetical protein